VFDPQKSILVRQCVIWKKFALPGPCLCSVLLSSPLLLGSPCPPLLSNPLPLSFFSSSSFSSSSSSSSHSNSHSRPWSISFRSRFLISECHSEYRSIRSKHARRLFVLCPAVYFPSSCFCLRNGTSTCFIFVLIFVLINNIIIASSFFFFFFNFFSVVSLVRPSF